MGRCFPFFDAPDAERLTEELKALKAELKLSFKELQKA